MTCPPNPCWQHYGSHYASQPPVAWVLSLADSLVRFRARALPTSPSVEDLQKLRDAVDLSINLQNAQWRDCVRTPFNFAPYAGADPDTYAEEGAGKVDIASILAPLLARPTITRR